MLMRKDQMVMWHKGVRYEAKPSGMFCTGCSLQENFTLCTGSIDCQPYQRKDGEWIHWHRVTPEEQG